MKSMFRFSIAAIVVLSAVTLMSAAPRSKTQAPDAHPGKGVAVSLVCGQCQASTDGADAMKQCIADGKLACSSCTTKSKFAAAARPANRPARRQVAYFNAKGDRCVFVAVAASTP
jgi:hypothetical protein